MQTHHTLSMLLREIQRQSMPTIASGPPRCDRAPLRFYHSNIFQIAVVVGAGELQNALC